MHACMLWVRAHPRICDTSLWLSECFHVYAGLLATGKPLVPLLKLLFLSWQLLSGLMSDEGSGNSAYCLSVLLVLYAKPVLLQRRHCLVHCLRVPTVVCLRLLDVLGLRLLVIYRVGALFAVWSKHLFRFLSNG